MWGGGIYPALWLALQQFALQWFTLLAARQVGVPPVLLPFEALAQTTLILGATA